MTSEFSQHDYFISISFYEQTYGEDSLSSFSLMWRSLMWQKKKKKDNVEKLSELWIVFPPHIEREVTKALPSYCSFP